MENSFGTTSRSEGIFHCFCRSKTTVLSSAFSFTFPEYSSDVDQWDVAFSEVMLNQQNRIAKLLSSVEQVKQDADEKKQKFSSHNTKHSIPTLRNHMVRIFRECSSRVGTNGKIGQART